MKPLGVVQAEALVVAKAMEVLGDAVVAVAAVAIVVVVVGMAFMVVVTTASTW